MQRWSFGLQKELKRTLIDIGYMGNRGTGLAVITEHDPVPARWLSTYPTRDQRTIDFLSQQVSDPYFGLSEFTGSKISGRNVARSQLLRPYSNFSSITASRGDGYNNWNLSPFKSFRFGERLRLQLRAEALGAMNHPLFESPNTAPTNSLFGTVGSVAANQQRQVWVGGKLNW